MTCNFNTNKILRLKASEQWAKGLLLLVIRKKEKKNLLKRCVKLSLETSYPMVNNLRIHRHLPITSLARLPTVVLKDAATQDLPCFQTVAPRLRAIRSSGEAYWIAHC